MRCSCKRYSEMGLALLFSDRHIGLARRAGLGRQRSVARLESLAETAHITVAGDRGRIGHGDRPVLEGAPRDLKESFYIATEHGPDHPGVVGKWPNHGPNPWPAEAPESRPKIEAYFIPMLDLGRHLMRMIALSLELPRDYFDDAFRDPDEFAYYGCAFIYERG